jgi:hypothetical protein
MPITVQHDPFLTPQWFIWQGHTHQVQQISKRWRIDQQWWEQRIWREYFKITTQSELLVIIYRDLLSGQWYLQRLYD